MVLQHLEYRVRRALNIDRLFDRETRGYLAEEFIARAYLLRLSGGMPCLIIDAPDQHRELITELGRLVDGQTIAQRVKYGAQNLIGTMPIQTQGFGDFLEPRVGLVQGFIEHFEAGRTHIRTFRIRSSTQAERTRASIDYRVWPQIRWSP